MNPKPRWWERLSEEDLVSQLPGKVIERACNSGLDGAGGLMPRYVEPDRRHAITPPYWLRLKREFHLLVCTDDPKYKDTRDKLDSSGGEAKTIVIATVSAAMADSLGFVAGAVTPFCVLCLIALLRLGKESFCSSSGWTSIMLDSDSTRSRNLERD